MAALCQFLAGQPFLAIFLALGLGYLLGRVSLGFFSVGSTAGSLIASLAIGAVVSGVGGAHFEIPDLVGTIFLIVCLRRAYLGHFTSRQHFGFEAAAWYWHFVDVVWLFLFVVVYVWGGWGAEYH